MQNYAEWTGVSLRFARAQPPAKSARRPAPPLSLHTLGLVRVAFPRLPFRSQTPRKLANRSHCSVRLMACENCIRGEYPSTRRAFSMLNSKPTDSIAALSASGIAGVLPEFAVAPPDSRFRHMSFSSSGIPSNLDHAQINILSTMDICLSSLRNSGLVSTFLLAFIDAFTTPGWSL